MKMLYVFGIIILIGGCAKTIPPPASSALLPEIDVVQVKEDSDEALRLAQEAKVDVEALNSKVTDLDNRVATLSDDIANISVAKIEEIENRLALLWEETKGIQKMLEGVEFRKKPSPPKPMATFKPVEGRQRKTKREKIDNSKASLIGANYKAYQKSLKAFNSRDYKKAIKYFKSLLEENRKGTYADNCTYWIGECFYMLGDFSQAIGWYRKVFDYTDTEKADDAQFKIAKSFMKLGESSQAVTEYENLLSLYPASEYVGRAKSDLQKLKVR